MDVDERDGVDGHVDAGEYGDGDADADGDGHVAPLVETVEPLGRSEQIHHTDDDGGDVVHSFGTCEQTVVCTRCGVLGIVADGPAHDLSTANTSRFVRGAAAD